MPSSCTDATNVRVAAHRWIDKQISRCCNNTTNTENLKRQVNTRERGREICLASCLSLRQQTPANPEGVETLRSDGGRSGTRVWEGEARKRSCHSVEGEEREEEERRNNIKKRYKKKMEGS